MPSKPDIPVTPTKRVDLPTDLDTIDAAIAEGTVWLDHHAPVRESPERTNFVAFLKGLMRYTTEAKDYFGEVEVSAASGSAFNLLDNLLEAIDFCVQCPDSGLGQIKEGTQWRVYGFRKPLRDVVAALTPDEPTYTYTYAHVSIPTSGVGKSDQHIPMRASKAFAQYNDAAKALGKSGPEDREAYDYVARKSEQDGTCDALPAFASWSRNLRLYRQHTNTQKRQHRAGRADNSGSIVKQSDL